MFSELSRRRFSAADGFGDGGSDLLIALEGLVLPLVLLPPPTSNPSPEPLDRPEDSLGRRLPLTLVLPPATLDPTPPPVGAPPPPPRAAAALVPRARVPTPPVNDVRFPAPRTLVLGLTPDGVGGLAVEEDVDSREARRPPAPAPAPAPPATDVLPPAALPPPPPPPPALVRPNPKLPPWLLRGLGGAVDAALPEARVSRLPWERGGLFGPRALPPALRREEEEEEDGPAGLLRLSWRVALPSCTWLT